MTRPDPKTRLKKCYNLNMDQPERKSLRLINYDYTTANCYFVTICIDKRENILGTMNNQAELSPSRYGQIVNHWWQSLPNRFPTIALDTFIIMPDHVHGIIFINPVGAGHDPPATLGQIVGYFKMNSAKEINLLRDQINSAFWQRNYFEHIIRNDQDLQKTREYITTNPLRWTLDNEHQTGGS